MSTKLKLTGKMRTIPMHDNEHKPCPIGCNHEVEWPTYHHVSKEEIDAATNLISEGDCMVIIPHHIIEGAWAALNTVMGETKPGGTLSHEHFAELDEAYANLDAYKHSEYEAHTYDVAELAMKFEDRYHWLNRFDAEKIASLEREAESLG